MPKSRGGLSHDFIIGIMKKSASRRKSGQKYADIAALHNLIEEEFVGTISSIADALDISKVRVSVAMRETRKPWFRENFGWTIPYVSMGPGPKLWVIAKTTKHYPIMYRGNRSRNAYLVSCYNNLKDAVDFEKKIASTRVQKQRAQAMSLHMRHIQELMELELDEAR